MEIETEGWTIVPGVLDAAQIASALEIIAQRLEEMRRDPVQHVGGTLHVDDLRDAGAPFARIAADARIEQLVRKILGENYTLNGFHYRAPQPGHGAQALHADHYASGKPGAFLVATAIVALVDFTSQNGATRVLPRSHLAPPRGVPSQPGVAAAGERVLTPRAGSAIVFNGHLWHSGTQNRSSHTRHALQLTYAVPDVLYRR